MLLRCYLYVKKLLHLFDNIGCTLTANSLTGPLGGLRPAFPDVLQEIGQHGNCFGRVDIDREGVTCASRGPCQRWARPGRQWMGCPGRQCPRSACGAAHPTALLPSSPASPPTLHTTPMHTLFSRQVRQPHIPDMARSKLFENTSECDFRLIVKQIIKVKGHLEPGTLPPLCLYDSYGLHKYTPQKAADTQYNSHTLSPYGSAPACMLSCTGLCKAILTDILRSSDSHSACIAAAVSLDCSIQGEVLTRSDLWPQDIELGAHAQALPDARHVREDGRPVYGCVAARRCQHACQDGDGCSLARTVVTCVCRRRNSRVKHVQSQQSCLH